MSAYEELVERCANAQTFLSAPGYDPTDDNIRSVLAEVLRTMGRVTPEMERAAEYKEFSGGYGYVDECYPADVSQVWLAMLRASPLTPG